MGAMPLPQPQQQLPGAVPTNSTPTSTTAPVQALPGLVPMGQTQNNPYAAPSAVQPMSSGGAHMFILPGGVLISGLQLVRHQQQEAFLLLACRLMGLIGMTALIL